MSFFRGHTTTIRGNKISDFTVSTAEYGAPVPEILGTTRVSGNVIYYDDFTAHEHRESQRSGKGGHRSKTVTISYTYTVAVLLGLCEGPIHGLKRVWKGKNIYTYPDKEIQLTLHAGAKDQAPWAYTQGKHPDKALSYSGLAYVAGVIDLGDSGSMPNYNFEVAGKLLDTGDGVDVNPADYIRYVLDKAGLSAVKIVGLDKYRKYCAAADLLISTPSDETSAKSAREIINEIATLTNAYVFWSNDTFKIVPLDDRTYSGWSPNRTVLYDLTADDFIPQSGGALVTYQRKDSSEVYNQYPVEFINRANGYEKETVSYAVTDDIADYGLRQANTTQAHYLYTKERAVKLAESLARKGKYARNKYTFKLDWSFCRLEVGDLVTLTDVNCGLNKQVVLIDSVTEGTDGLLTFTAISRPDGAYSAATYDVHANDRPYVNYNIAAPDTAPPVLLQPPSDLTANGLELWIGAKGSADGWGGCDVYVSDDNAHYRPAGQITSTARIGTLATTVTKAATAIEVAVNGTFLSGAQQDADRGNTLCWLDGECLSYQTAELLANGHYQLSGLVRGQYQTTAAAHNAEVSFCRLDNTLLKIAFRKEDIGKQIYLKFVSFNVFGSGNQSLADVEPVRYTLAAYSLPAVTQITAYTRYEWTQDRESTYAIVVSWTPPELQSYLEGNVWYKRKSSGSYAGEWSFGGAGVHQVIIPQAVVGNTYKIAVTTKDKHGFSTAPDIAPFVELVVAVKSEIPLAPPGAKITFDTVTRIKWDEVTNTDIAYYELRTDQNPGNIAGLLMQTNDLQATLTLGKRSGTIYLYAKSTVGAYSTPATLTYNKPIPATPAAPVVTAKIGALAVETDAIPIDCIGAVVRIKGALSVKSIKIQDRLAMLAVDPDIYDVTVTFYDLFGEGAESGATTCTVKPTIDPELLRDMQVTEDNLNATLKQTLADLQSANESTSTAMVDLKDADAAMQSSLDAMEQTIVDNKQAIEMQVVGINENVNEVVKTAAGNTATIATVQKQADGINAKVMAQQTSIYGINTTIAGIKSDVNGQTTKINILSNTVDGNKATISAVQTLADQAISKASSVEQTVSGFKSTVTAQISGSDAYAQALSAMAHGKLLNPDGDTCFKTLRANLYTLGVNPPTAETLTYVEPFDTAPQTGGKLLRIFTSAAGMTSSASGGVHFAKICKGGASVEYIFRMIANVPIGHTINLAQNSLGDSGGYAKWITANAGTGDWQEYIGMWHYGTTFKNAKWGTTSGHFYITNNNGNQTEDFEWYVSSIAFYDVTQYQLVPDSIQTQITQNADSISGIVKRVSTNETNITALKVTDSSLSSTISSNYTALAGKISSNASKITQTANSVSAVVANLSKAPNATGYAAFTQLYNAVGLKVAQGDVMTYLNLSPTTVKIKSSLISIDGNTTFANNVIVNRMLAARAVTADKMSIGSLSAICANLGTVTAGTISGTTITGNTITGGTINGTVINSGTINANVIKQSGFNIKNFFISKQIVKNGDVITIPSGFTREQCDIVNVGMYGSVVRAPSSSYESDITSFLNNNGGRITPTTDKVFVGDDHIICGLNGLTACCWYSYSTLREGSDRGDGYIYYGGYGSIVVIVIAHN
ncbi:phage tail protein [uncultured Megasphaera sp.]|uniref:phage tail protein n=1 Tax=uncultured Megasphaera sp. TaxID=165188 RepID=UPI002596BF05|nr:phage tail protein [uncultured Megasphaera sp.]